MQTFETPGPVLVSVECAAGEVDVDTHDEARTTVEVTALRDDDVSREAAERTRVDLRASGEVVVEVPDKHGSFFGREPRVRIVVRAPHDSGLAFRTASAEVTARGRLGSVHGKTASGDVVVDSATELRVQTASGDLRIGEVRGPAEVHSASGDIAVRHVGGPLDANVVSGELRVAEADLGGSVRSVSGDVDLAAVGGGHVALTSVSGDVRIGVRPGLRVHVDVTTLSGDLTSDLDLGDAPAGGEGPLVEIRGRTVSGDVRVRRAALVP